MTRSRALAVALPLGLLAAAPAGAQLGKWVDAQGRTYYGDQPPQTLVKEKAMAMGTVSMADGAPFQAAPAKWSARSGGGGSAVGIGGSSPAATPSAPSRGYRRCGR